MAVEVNGWTLTALLRFDGSGDDGAWVAGTTTWNQVGQGETPSEALESLMICLTVAAAYALKEGREPPAELDEGRAYLAKMTPEQRATLDENLRRAGVTSIGPTSPAEPKRPRAREIAAKPPVAKADTPKSPQIRTPSAAPPRAAKSAAFATASAPKRTLPSRSKASVPPLSSPAGASEPPSATSAPTPPKEHRKGWNAFPRTHVKGKPRPKAEPAPVRTVPPAPAWMQKPLKPPGKLSVEERLEQLRVEQAWSAPLSELEKVEFDS